MARVTMMMRTCILLLLSAASTTWAQTQPLASSVALVSPTEVVIGIVTDTNNTIVSVRYSRSENNVANNRGSTSRRTNTTTLGSDNRFTASITLGGLQPDTTYFYSAILEAPDGSATVLASAGADADAAIPKFKTFPRKDKPRWDTEFSFTVFGNAARSSDNRPAQCYVSGGNGENAVIGSSDYSSEARSPLFAVQLGNFDISRPTSLQQARAMHASMRDDSFTAGSQFAANILTKLGLFHSLMEYDYCGGANPDRFCPTKEDAIQAFKEYYPGYKYPSPAHGLFYNFTIGTLVEVFVLDTMTQRDPVEWPDNSTKSMLQGGHSSSSNRKYQKNWFLNALKKSPARWKIIVSSVGANGDTALLDDDQDTIAVVRDAQQSYVHWGDYASEARNIRDAIRNEPTLRDCTVMISGNLQSGGAIDDGRNNLFGIPELSVPISNLEQGNVDNVGTWSVGVLDGQNNVKQAEGFARVTVTYETLTLETLDQNGTQTFDYQLYKAPDSEAPSTTPSRMPSQVPSQMPSQVPSQMPSSSPFPTWTWKPSARPTVSPAPTSTLFPSVAPTDTQGPSAAPSLVPSQQVPETPPPSAAPSPIASQLPETPPPSAAPSPMASQLPETPEPTAGPGLSILTLPPTMESQAPTDVPTFPPLVNILPETEATETDPESDPTETDPPVVTDPTPTETDPTPTETDPTPTETDPTPTETDPTPTETDPPPTETDPVPTETDPPPTETDPTPTETDPVPTETDPPPTETDPTPTDFEVNVDSGSELTGLQQVDVMSGNPNAPNVTATTSDTANSTGTSGSSGTLPMVVQSLVWFGMSAVLVMVVG